MRFKLPACDPQYLQANNIPFYNGGTVWLHNIAHALRYLGHEAEVISLGEDYNDCDYVIIQSEWTAMPQYQTCRTKKIVLLGHFIKHVYPDPRHMNADYLITTWKGECTDGFNAHFIPHAYSNLIDDGGSKYAGDIVWAGNPYPLREEGWFNGIDVTRITGHPTELLMNYRSAKVCLGLHGDFQKNIVSKEESKIADKPGEMINERFWNVIGAGGLLVSDFVPQMLEFFDESELIIGKTKEEYQEKVRYYQEHKDEGIELLQKARDKILAEHTYINRVNKLIELL
jgi:hypothetical protein